MLWWGEEKISKPDRLLEAALAGWRVVRLGPNELTAAHVGRLVSLVNAA